MKIYTKTGDKGITSLFGGERVGKNSAMIEACGAVDELNSLIGVILSDDPKPGVSKKLLRIQEELFVLGADLASLVDVKVKVPRVTKGLITRLEKEINEWEKELPKLRNFILPGGGKVGSKLHLARAVCRRAERTVVRLNGEKINNLILVYLNRLSDWFFVLARYVNKLERISEKSWAGRRGE